MCNDAKGVPVVEDHDICFFICFFKEAEFVAKGVVIFDNGGVVESCKGGDFSPLLLSLSSLAISFNSGKSMQSEFQVLIRVFME